MNDYDTHKENQAFQHLEKMQEIAEKCRKEFAEKQRAESENVPAIGNSYLEWVATAEDGSITTMW